MPDEKLIAEIESLLSEVISLGGQNERSKMVPNLIVQTANPTGLDGFIIISDNRDGDNILAKKVPSVIYTNNDLVNVLFPEGGEAIAFQQGSQSGSGGIWEIVPATTTDIFYDRGDVGIGKSVVPDARLEILDIAQAQLRLTFEEDTKFTTFTVDTSHDLTIDPSSTGLIKLSADITVTNLISHEGDLDTEIALTDDDIEATVGGLSMLKLTEAGQDLITLGPGSGDVDVDFNGDMFLQGSDGNFGVGISVPLAKIHIDQSNAAGAIPVLLLDQEDDSEQGIKFSSSSVDEDINLYTVDVTGIPTMLWDESEDGLDWNKAFLVQGLFTTQAGQIKNTTRITDADSPYTVLATDNIILADTDGGVITVNLPAGIDGTHYRITNTGSSANDVTVDPNGTEQLFNGGAGVSFALIDAETINIYFETTENWW